MPQNLLKTELPKAYDPAAIEDRWAAYWVDEHLFSVATSLDVAPAGTAPAEPFTMLLPPPNVTGKLHMGHMLNQTEMDILARWRRMSGDTVLWVPGMDHASIATQMMVERQIAAEGTTREQLGREGFLERAWQWKSTTGGAILTQMKRLGASVDWSREYFTMDDRLSPVVREAFVRLHEQGLVYRGAYIVNWDPVQKTAVSDLEVEHEDRIGKLYYVCYPLADGTGEIVIATTRPETMLGDTAVAVNPTDERYQSLIGKRLRLPLSGVHGGPDREIPILADSWASAEFGTGAVKVTPAHDPNDFAIGERHSLPKLTIMDAGARIDLPGSVYHTLDRYAAREKIVEDLRALGLLVDVKDHPMSIGLSQRTGAVIEPRLSTQWFLRIQPLADKAIAAVDEGHVRFTPDQYRKTYDEWMRNIRDWCLSRQLWWGHRIPAWHCDTCAHITVARETPLACEHCGGAALTQDSDVLDTWFSSGLLPFTVFGWPEATADLAAFYPTQLLVTGFDILFFWVARMIMLGCWFMEGEPGADGKARQLKDAVPFREVYIHALVKDADRQKMSKTKGNVIDPIAIVEQYGTDAVRFTLASMASPGTDIAFNEDRTQGYRAFANKIWNAARFIFMNVERAEAEGVTVDLHAAELIPCLDIEALWIRSRLGRTVAEVNEALADYRFHEASSLVYQFFWGDFCDWYLEIVKLRLNYSGPIEKAVARSALSSLLGTFEASLRLLSPFMPFITEELWHALYDGDPPKKSVALTSFPVPVPADVLIDVHMAQLQELVTAIRVARKELGVEEKVTVPVRIRAAARLARLFADNRQMIERLARVSMISFVAETPQGAGVRSAADFDVQVVYEKQIDLAAERERLLKELARLEKEQSGAESKLANESFLAKAPGPIVEGIRRRSAELVVLIDKARAALADLEQQ